MLNEVVFRVSRLGTFELDGSEVANLVLADCDVKLWELTGAKLAQSHVRACRIARVTAATALAGRIVIEDSPGLTALHAGVERFAAQVSVDGVAV